MSLDFSIHLILLADKTEGKRALEKYSSRWKEIKMNNTETAYERVKYSHLALDNDSTRLFHLLKSEGRGNLGDTCTEKDNIKTNKKVV
jgi:hypothetical protein